MSENSISLHIEKIVLEGFDTLDTHALEAALGQELQRLLVLQTTPELFRQSVKLNKAQVNSVRLQSSVQGRQLGWQLGRQIAGALHRGFQG